uniref:5-phosphohydroxy-L-lysine phospho-lyase n=1 Tax=Cyprinus carpio TaxID=7962 RepID=A0A8C1U5N5_CYPCA
MALEVFNKDETLQMRRKLIGKQPCRLFFVHDPVKIMRAMDCISDVQHGKDILTCIGTLSPQHHSAAAAQMDLLNSNTRFLHDNIVLYANRLAATLPKNLVSFIWSTQGNNFCVIFTCLSSAYHGHLTSLIDISPYKFRKLEGQKEWVHVAPLPDTYHGIYREDHLDPGQAYADTVKSLIEEAHKEVFTQIIFPTGYCKRLAEYVHEAGGVYVADEIQTGFGHVGSHFWAFQLQGEDFCPDIVRMGKLMGNGHHIACVATTEEIADAFTASGVEYFNTFGGNPVSCAIGLAVLDVIEKEDLRGKAVLVGGHLKQLLLQLQTKHPLIGDVRGVGLFIGMELVKDRVSKATEGSAHLVQEERIVMSTDGPRDSVIKFKPPMCFSIEDAERVSTCIDQILGGWYEKLTVCL